MRLRAFAEDSRTEIATSFTSLLLPDFESSFFETLKGRLLMQSFANDQNSIWRLDFDLQEEVTTKFVDSFRNFRFLVIQAGTIFMDSHLQSLSCCENTAVIVNLDAHRVRIPPGRSTIWIMNPNGAGYERLNEAITLNRNKVAIVPFWDLSTNLGGFMAPGGDAISSFIWEAGINLLYAMILRQFNPNKIDYNSLYSRHREAIKLRSYLLENYTNPVLFYKLKVDPTLRRSFVELYKMTPAQYLKEVRVLHAERLLQETEMKIQEIAWEVGYHQSSFTRIFTLKMGISPQDFRNHIKEKSIVVAKRISFQ